MGTTKTDVKNIQITHKDYERLVIMIQHARSSGQVTFSALNMLGEELKRAKKVKPEKISPKVITMNSRLQLTDMETDKTMDLILVYPDEADIKQGKVSILAPVGTALLGYAEGDEIEWEVPAGKRMFKISKVTYQPEAEGDLHL